MKNNGWNSNKQTRFFIKKIKPKQLYRALQQPTRGPSHPHRAGVYLPLFWADHSCKTATSAVFFPINGSRCDPHLMVERQCLTSGTQRQQRHWMARVQHCHAITTTSKAVGCKSPRLPTFFSFIRDVPTLDGGERRPLLMRNGCLLVACVPGRRSLAAEMKTK